MQADGQIPVIKATRHTHGADPRQVHRHREDVAQVHLQRVLALLANAEGGGGSHRAGDGIHIGKGAGKVILDEGAHLLRLAVVGVIVACAQRVGAEHDASLDLGAEATAARLAVILEHGVGARAVAEAHAVEAGQVGACLGGGHQIVDGKRLVGVGQRDGHNGCAQRLQLRDGRAHGGFNLRLEAVYKILLRQPHAHTRQRAIQRGHKVGCGIGHAGAVLGVAARHDAQEQGGVLHVLRQHPHRVEAGAVGHKAVAADAPIGGLEAHHSAVGCGQAHAAARVGAQRAQRHLRCHRRSRAAAAAAGNALRVPGIVCDRVGAVLCARAHGELVHVRLAHHHHTCRLQACHRCGRVGGNIVLQNAAAAGSAHARRAQHILDGKRNAQQRRILALRAAGVGGMRLFQRAVGCEGDKGAHLRLERVNARQVRLGELHRGEVARAQARQCGVDCERVQRRIHYASPASSKTART